MTSASTFREGRLSRYYRCNTRNMRGKEGGPTVQLRADTIERFMVACLQRLLADPENEASLQRCLGLLGLLTPNGTLSELWDYRSLGNRQRLV